MYPSELESVIDEGTLQLDRRQGFRREPIREGTCLWTLDQRRIPAEIVDESTTGIGLCLPANVSFELGPRVWIEHDNARRLGTVVHVTRDDDDSYRLGVEWVIPGEE